METNATFSFTLFANLYSSNSLFSYSDCHTNQTANRHAISHIYACTNKYRDNDPNA